MINCFLISSGIFLCLMLSVSAHERAVSNAWFKSKGSTRLDNVTKEVLSDIKSSSECLKMCKYRRTTGAFACSSANYDNQNRICELCDATGNSTSDNGWYMWSLYPTHDCSEIYRHGQYKSGSYNIYLPNVIAPVTVYCDMDTDGGGWTVFQRRVDGSVDFHLDWQHYRDGFGDVNKEFWLGNDNLHYITSSGPYELRVDMTDVSDIIAFAKYSNFSVNNETDKYRLTISGYDALSSAGDSLTTGQVADQMQFSTYDADHDSHATENCAEKSKGAWWYASCHDSNLNGLYLNGNHTSLGDGINWSHFRGFYHSLLFTEMKIRPSGFSND